MSLTSAPPLDPYAPPRADLAPAPPVVAGAFGLASRWRRLGGAMVDATLSLLAHATIYLGISMEMEEAAPNAFVLWTTSGRWGFVAGFLTVGLALLQWSLMTRRGQSIGKIALRTRMVRRDGRAAGFLRGVVLRDWPISGPWYVLPFLGWSPGQHAGIFGLLAIVLFADALFIFGPARRCLHDRLADTVVVAVPKATTSADTDPAAPATVDQPG